MRSKKNRNLFRRLTTLLHKTENHKLKIAFCFLLSAFCFLTFISCDKEEMIMNSWNLQTVLMNNEPYNDSLQFNLVPRYTYYDFLFANTLNVRTFVIGEYASSADGFYKFVNKSTIEMRFSLLYKRYHITAKIKKLTRKELHLEYEKNGNVYYLKLYAN